MSNLFIPSGLGVATKAGLEKTVNIFNVTRKSKHSARCTLLLLHVLFLFLLLAITFGPDLIQERHAVLRRVRGQEKPSLCAGRPVAIHKARFRALSLWCVELICCTVQEYLFVFVALLYTDKSCANHVESFRIYPDPYTFALS